MLEELHERSAAWGVGLEVSGLGGGARGQRLGE